MIPMRPRAPVLVLIAALLGGCAEPGAEPAGPVSTPGAAAVPAPDTLFFNGTVGPTVIGLGPTPTSGFVAAFERSPSTTSISINFSQAALAPYRLTILAGPSREPVVDWAAADNPTPAFTFNDVSPPYEARIEPTTADAGFSWEATVTQYYWPEAEGPNNTELAERLERRARSDNESAWFNGTAYPPTLSSFGSNKWTTDLAHGANYTIVEVAVATLGVHDAHLTVTAGGTELLSADLDSDDPPFHGIIAGIPGPYEIHLEPFEVDRPLDWRAVVTQFYTEEPESNWSALRG